MRPGSWVQLLVLLPLQLAWFLHWQAQQPPLLC
jgi:hypothetical protein